ncbi:MAG: 1-acyl-sn-glycerol-3-phosphate acyltransferase [Bacteroidota bacterium]
MKFSLRRQSTGKIFVYMAQIMPWSLPGFFKAIYLNNRKGVPSDKPVLLACNHPTAFMDPILFCLYLDPPIYNMTRGDIFEKPFFRKLLASINMFPVYRVRDGYASRERNDGVFEYCIDKMQQKRVVTIYVEGEHHLDKQLRPVQKGIARIAFAAYEKHRQEDLQIIPAGCNYWYGDRVRDTVMLNIGEPIYVRNYWAEYEENQTQAINTLCADLEIALQKYCFHVEQTEDQQAAEQLLELYRSEHPAPLLPATHYNTDKFESEKAVVDRLNALEAVKKEQLKNDLNAYFGALQVAGLKDAALIHPEWGNPVWLLFFVLGLIPAFVGWLGNRPPAFLARYVTKKAVKKKEFVTSVLYGVGYLGAMVYYILCTVISLFVGNPYLIGLVLLLPVLWWFSAFYRELWARWTGARRARGHGERERLLGMRGKLDRRQPS